MRVALCVLVLGALAAAQEAAQTLEGWVDERAGADYVLRGANDLQVIAHLRPAQDNPEVFAKYLGHRVRVRGRTMSATSGVPTITVQEVTRLSPPTASTGSADRQAGMRETLTGVISGKTDGSYVLRDPFTDNVVAVLAPSETTRADVRRYRGQRVLVEGQLSVRATTPVLTVETIKPFPPE